MKENPWARLLAYVTGLINQELLSRTNTWRLRIASCGPTCQLVRGYPIPKGPRWPKSASAWGGRRCPRSPALPARHNSGLVSKAHRPEVRRIQTPPLSRQAADRAEIGGVDRANGEGKFWLGLRPDCGRAVQPRLYRLGSDCRERPEAHGIAPAPKRSQNTTWKEFIQSHLAVLAGIDFFTVEVLTWRGLVTYYVLFFIHLESRRVGLAGITRHPDQAWMQQMARNATGESWGFLDQRRYVLHDRDTKFCSVFRATLTAGGIKPIQLPARSPHLNSYAERWVRSVKGECLSKLILFGEASLRRALTDFIDHYHGERNHQGKGNVLLFPHHEVGQQKPRSRVRCRERLGGPLRYYSYVA